MSLRRVKIVFDREALISIRVGQGISRRDLADLAGVNRSQLWRIEQGHSTPTEGTVAKLARVLGVPVSSMMTVTSVDAA